MTLIIIEEVCQNHMDARMKLEKGSSLSSERHIMYSLHSKCVILQGLVN